MDARGIPPTYSFHLAKAYAPARQAQPSKAAAPSPSIDSVELSKPRSKSVSGLVGAKVNVAPDFTPTTQAAAPDALPMYRHPADKNAAATGVSLGRAIDFNA